MTQPIDLKRVQQACGTCSLRELCLPYGISDAELGQLEDIVERRKPIPRGEALFHQGQPLGALFAVRSGSVKTAWESGS